MCTGDSVSIWSCQGLENDVNNMHVKDIGFIEGEQVCIIFSFYGKRRFF